MNKRRGFGVGNTKLDALAMNGPALARDQSQSSVPELEGTVREEANARKLDLHAYLDLIARRKWQMTIPAVVVFAIVLGVALSIPSVYRSTATILVEEPEISQDPVRSDTAASADERVQLVSRQVMTRANLWQIAEKFDLYPQLRKPEPTEAVIELMRKNIGLEMISASANDPRSFKQAPTIAFNLSFDAESPEKAQRVADELVSLYLNENLRRRQRKAADTTDFFADEAKKHSDRIAELEGKLARFKERNIARLPELQTLNIQLRDRSENEILDAERQIRSLDERRLYLEGQLAQTKPNTPIFTASGERILDTPDRLKQLEVQYAGLAATYSSQHPDVAKMRREIEALRKQDAASGASTKQADEVVRLREALNTARERYSDDHPDVAKLRKALAAQEGALVESAQSRPEAQVHARQPENPAYIALRTQLEATKTELKTWRAKQIELRGRVAEIGTRLAQTPQVEREYLELSRERENELKRYQEIRARQMGAQSAEELERDRKAERFSMIERPQLPERANRPNRRAMLIFGLLLAIGLGVGCGILLETLDDRVHGPDVLRGAHGLRLLAVIPYIETKADRSGRLRGRMVTVGLLVAAIGTALLLVNSFGVQLDVVAMGLLRKLGA